MNALSGLPAFPAYAGTVIVLGLNLVGLANATALTRGRASEVINPEDVALNKKASVVFAALRIIHSVCYVKAVQPFRTLSFVLALIIQTVVLGFIGYGAFVG